MVKVLLNIALISLLVGCGDNILSETTIIDSHNTDDYVSDGNDTTIDGSLFPDTPTFNGNSQGKILARKDGDICYITFAYDCLRQDTKVGLKSDSGTIVIEDETHIGEVFAVTGYVEMGDKEKVTVTGTVFSGGNDLPTNGAWIATCK